MSDDKKREIVRKVLAWLYEDWAHHRGRSLNVLRKEEQWDKSDFDTAIARLKDSGFIKNGSSNSFDLTPDGVNYVEENLIAPESEIERHKELRTKALGFLEDLYQERGSGAYASVEQIAQGCGLNTSDLYVDLCLLSRWDYLENIGTNSYRITDRGRRYYRGADYEDII